MSQKFRLAIDKPCFEKFEQFKALEMVVSVILAKKKSLILQK